MHIVILGAGYIGKNLEKLLNTKAHKVTLIKRDYLDYHNPTKLKSLDWADCVINASGFTGRPNIDECETKKELCHYLNVQVPIKITQALEESRCRLIHITSGCIYGGYQKEFTEQDTPNMGLYANEGSSYYSKCKHEFELVARGRADLLRIRMPINNDCRHPRNFLSKIANYPRLINAKNSKSYIPDLAGFINALVQTELPPDTYNVVNQGALTTKDVIAYCGLPEPTEWVNLEDLKLAAPRSNCVLSNAKASKIYTFKEEREIYTDKNSYDP
jgi:dTDP-4-dehydrorhamnose reductase